ncbi:MAG: AmmeMemoRadiSam system radical SAM enzyme [Nitrososphaerales archaeon]
MREALLWRTEGERIRCNLCARRCLIPKGIRGFCQTRENIDGALYASMYGEVSMMGVDPIEKKPFFHFYPGSLSLSISTVGCTFRCKFCQNYDISQKPFGMRRVEPRDVAEDADRQGCRSVSYTYNEPTVFFEYSIDTAKEALKRGVVNTFVTNGYMTPEAVEYAAKYIQAMTVGVKGSLNREFSARLMAVPNSEAIQEAMLEMKRRGVHIEVTDLLVTKYGDSMDDVRRFARWIHDNLGPDTPLHFTRFHPDWLLTDVPPTPVETLERAHATAKEEGIRYVYAGNVPGHPLENTYCPGCNELLIKRWGFHIEEWKIKDRLCPRCGAKIFYIDHSA